MKLNKKYLNFWLPNEESNFMKGKIKEKISRGNILKSKVNRRRDKLDTSFECLIICDVFVPYKGIQEKIYNLLRVLFCFVYYSKSSNI